MSGHNPRVNLIEKLWANFRQKGHWETLSAGRARLPEQVNSTWLRLQPDVTANLVAEISKCMRDCILVNVTFGGK